MYKCVSAWDLLQHPLRLFYPEYVYALLDFANVEYEIGKQIAREIITDQDGRDVADLVCRFLAPSFSVLIDPVTH